MIQDRSRFRPARHVLPALSVDLPAVSGAQVAMWDVIAAHVVEGALPVFGEDMRYRACAPEMVPEGAGSELSLRVNGRDVTIWLDFDLFEQLEGLEELVPVLDRLDPVRLGFAVEHLLRAPIAALEARLDLRIEVTQMRRNRTLNRARAGLGFEILDGEGALALTAWLVPAAPEPFAEALAGGHARRAPRSLKHLTVPVSLIGPAALLARAELRALGEGDVFFPSEHWTSKLDFVHMVVADRHIVPLSRADGGFVLGGPEDDLNLITKRLTEGGRMSESDTSKPGALNDPRTFVTIELERREMTVSEIEGLQKGSVLPCEIASVDEVLLCADGVPVAAGRLVQLETKIGVQITRLI